MNRIAIHGLLLGALLCSSLAFGMAQKNESRITNVEVAATNQTILIVPMNDPLQSGLIRSQPLREVPVGKAAFIDSIHKGKQELLNPVSFTDRLIVVSQDTDGNEEVTHINKYEAAKLASSTGAFTLVINQKGVASLIAEEKK